MAKHKRNTRALAVFADTLAVPVDGTDIHVPRTSEANKALNCLLVSQLRHVFQENLRRIKQMDQAVSPREMKDLIDSMARLTEASHDVYKTLEDLDDGAAKPAEKVAVEDDAIEADFDQLTPNKDGNTRPIAGQETGPSDPSPAPTPG